MPSGTLLEIAMIHAESLIEKARNGDESAVGRLVSLWYKRIYNFCLKYFGDHDLAMEACQQTFISMYRSVHNLKSVDHFRPWLYRIALNQCHDEERKRKKHMSISYSADRDRNDEDQWVLQVKDQERKPDEKMHQDELNEMLHDSFLEIPAEQREVLIMKEFEGLKFREIAEVLEISENTVKSRLYYGLSHLKNILERKNISKESIYYG